MKLMEALNNVIYGVFSYTRNSMIFFICKCEYALPKIIEYALYIFLHSSLTKHLRDYEYIYNKYLLV